MPTATAEPRAKRAYRNRISSIPEKAANVQYIDYEPRGACRDLFLDRSPELIVDGPAGSGKSRACLEKCHWLLEKYPAIRGLMIRKTRKSMTQSCIVTFEQEVLPSPKYVPFHGTDNQYNYPNGSIFAVSGLDDPTKIYSSFWDFAYVNQAEELTEDEWTQIGSRLRNFKMSHKGVPWTQLLGDDNPVHPQHWIPARARAIDELTGRHLLTKLESRHEDNPVYWDIEAGDWTQKGRIYIATLDRLFGVLKKRLRYGLWAAAEGAVYEESFDAAVHVIPRFYAQTDLRHDQVPKDWPRFWCIDFGYTNPFTWAAFAQDPDGRLIQYKQIYMTKRLVEDHARKILEYTADDPPPKAIICDHDAEDRATLQKHLGIPLAKAPDGHPFADRLKGYCVNTQTKGAYKAVSQGIQAVEARLRIAGDGKPRLLYMRDSLIEVDPALLAAKEPTDSESEFPVYCLTADTQVATETGTRSLSDINVGDLVWTREGLHAVLNSGMTNPSAKVYRVELSNGTCLVGTGEHPVFVKGKGFTPISGLLCFDIMETCARHANLKSFSLTASDIVGTLSQKIMRLVSISGATCRIGNGDTADCTLTSGRRSTDLFRQATSYITRTITRLTTASRIWFALPNASMLTCTGGTQYESLLHGSRSWTTRAFLQESPVRLLDTNESRSKPRPNSGKLDPRPKEFARTAAQSFLAAVSRRLSFAPLFVIRVLEESGARPVYNLTVDGCPEYFANGVLVHNCWDRSNNKKKGEEPVKRYDHGKDRDRYLVAHVDQVGKNTPKMFGMVSITKSGGAGAGPNALSGQSGFRMDGGSGLRSKWSNT